MRNEFLDLRNTYKKPLSWPHLQLTGFAMTIRWMLSDGIFKTSRADHMLKIPRALISVGVTFRKNDGLLMNGHVFC